VHVCGRTQAELRALASMLAAELSGALAWAAALVAQKQALVARVTDDDAAAVDD
jgi:hypothetical protein